VRTVDRHRDGLARMRASMSWRITSPLPAVKSWLAR
jgi:hypothetical protein